MSSAREVARVMGIEKSPVLNHYAESIAGAATIRGFDQNQRFLETNIQLFDVYARPAFLNFALIEWIIFRMELLCSIIFAFSLIIVLSLSDSIVDPSKILFQPFVTCDVCCVFLTVFVYLFMQFYCILYRIMLDVESFIIVKITW